MFSLGGIVSFLEPSAQLGILAIAAALLMIAGEFDLGIGSMIAFGGMMVGIPLVQWGWPLELALLFAFAVAILVGFLNGVIVLRTGLPSFIVTLAALFILRGLTLVGLKSATGGTTQLRGIGDVIPEGHWLLGLLSGTAFKDLFSGFAERGWIETFRSGVPKVQGLPVEILWFVALTLIATWILLATRLGNWIFASGGDAVAARNVGVPVSRVKILMFCTTACAATLVGVMNALDFGSTDAARGTGKEFEAIIAAVIGGCLLTGGYGSAVGAFFGAILFGMVSIGISFTDIDQDWFKVFLGGMVLLAVLLNSFVRKQMMRPGRSA
ncbi:MAG: ABC transporter permease [Candidatus Eisenbacteria bacterium]|uniref:Xylose transport system permease protein XylH n=1 Tax=Eiseniibacteriota bacterium TaxID=2212470 RepID=A0A7Y2EFB6_UNCEI|nr:ABC transporter permease [Candidatus Eisenbacteria bacterium]